MKGIAMGFWIFISIFFAIGFAMLGWGLPCLYKANVYVGWLVTSGTLTSCELTENSDGDGTTWQVKVTYDYSVDGRSYSGDRVAFGYSGSSTHAEHQALHAKLSQAAVVNVRYNPSKHSEAVLGAGLNRSNVIILVFATVWL